MKHRILAAVAWAAFAATGAAAQPAANDEAAIAQSREAFTTLDVDRLGSDRDYAAEMLPHIDRVLASLPAEDRELREDIEMLRLYTLVTLDRRDEIAPILDAVASRRSRDPDDYASAVYAALRIEDHPRAVVLVEAASRNVAGVGWGQLREGLDKDNMWMLLGELDRSGRSGELTRLAQALFRIGWPGDGDAGSADYLRTLLLEDRLAQGDLAAARDYAAGLSTVQNVVGLIVRPRYDEVLSPGSDRIALLETAIAAEDRATAAAVEGGQASHQRLLERVQFLRGVGRNEEAVTLLQPHLADVSATVAASDEGMWLVNEAAYALIALGRDAEAIALMRQLTQMPIGERIELIGPVINFAEMLFQTGRATEGLEHATWLDREAGQYANDYGKMWIASAIACSLARLDRGGEAEPQIERLRAHAEVNPAALMQAYLCLGRDDEAAALMVERLGRDDPEPAILALQDYAMSRGPAQTGTVYERLLALRERPDVRAALGRVGRVLTLPLSRSYWGNF